MARYLQEGRVLCEEALKRPGFDKEVALHYNLAQFLARGGHLDAAIKRLSAGLAHKPRHIESLYYKAYLKMKQRDAALATDRRKHAERLLAEARELWKQVAALGGSRHPHGRQAIQCLRIVARWEQAARKLASSATGAPLPADPGN
jgi:Tfp pilus assembly protein PilF